MSPAALTLALITLFSAGQGHGPVSLQTYRQAVHAIRVRLDSAGPAPDQAATQQIQQELRALVAVRLADGHVVRTDLPSLGDQLRPSDSHSIARVRSVLDALERSLSASRSRAVGASQLSALDAVLRDARFHPVRPPWAPLIDWLRDLHDRFLIWLRNAVNTRSPTNLGFAAVLVLLVAGVGYLLARGALSRLVVERGPSDESAPPATASDAEERAAGQAAAGNYRDALRYLFLATMLGLQERGAIELRPGVTNREYLRRLRDAGMPAGIDQPLAELVDAFDAVWYGHAEVDGAGFRHYQDLSRRILADAPREAA